MSPTDTKITKNNPVKAGLILASASPRRLDLLAQIGLVPDAIIPADIDEAAEPHERPDHYARRMAAGKAALIARDHPGQYVLGGDTVVACGQRILPKAETEAEARQCMRLLCGRQHSVYGGICLITPAGEQKLRLSITQVRLRRLAADELAAYLAFGDWQGKAGGYAIQGMAARYIQRITGSYSNVVGLDLYAAAGLLRAAGFGHGPA